MKLLWVCSLLIFCGKSFAQDASYRITFTGLWNENQSATYPSSAHFTQLVGTTHRQGDSFWQAGTLASNGVEDVAELGRTQALRDEIQAARDNDRAGETILLDSLFILPSSTSTSFTISRDKANISLISMVAPSPDWFVGVSDLSLRNGNRWIPSLSINLSPYDAGTEEGNEFSLNNPDTLPQVPISPLSNSPFFGNAPVIGRLEFELLSVSPESSIEGALAPIVQLILED